VRSVKNKLTETSKTPSKEEFLLSNPNSVSEQHRVSFDDSPPSWKAGTLPLSYSRWNHVHFSPKALPRQRYICITFAPYLSLQEREDMLY
jgi:hypothetical protein